MCLNIYNWNIVACDVKQKNLSLSLYFPGPRPEVSEVNGCHFWYPTFKCKIQKNWCTVTVQPTKKHHGVHSRTPANQRRDQVPGRSQRLLLDYIGSVKATTHQEKGIITLESNPSRGTVLPAPHSKGNKCGKNVKYKRTDALSLWHQQ